MILTNRQLQQLLDIFNRYSSIFIASTLGPELLSSQEISTLRSVGIKVETLYKKSNDPILLNYYLGFLSDIIGKSNVKKLTFDQLKHYIESGQHIPLSEGERATIDSIRHQALVDIKAQQGRIFQDINRVVANVSAPIRSLQEQVIREHIIQGITRRESLRKISTDLSKLTGDWSRNFYKSVQYISHLALNEGRLSVIQKRYVGGGGKCYFIVQDTACEHCIKAYLTKGKGSAPKIFTVEEILANGSNIGRKVDQYKPTLIIHPNCRCLLQEYIEPSQKPSNRAKIRIVFNGIEYWV